MAQAAAYMSSRNHKGTVVKSCAKKKQRSSAKSHNTCLPQGLDKRAALHYGSCCSIWNIEDCWQQVSSTANEGVQLHGQVVETNSWLENAGDKALGNDPSFSWLKQLKNIAYDVDDIVDEFQLKAEKHEATAAAGILSKYLCNKPKSIIFQCKVASKIKAIKEKFAAIVKQRNNFSTIINSLPVGHPTPHMNKAVGEMPLLPNIDAASVVGRDNVKHQLISKLVEVKDQQIINIVSIIGLGGSGKTTLAKLVFNAGNIIDKHFEVKLWVHVSSQEFDVAMLIGKLFEAIAGEKSEQYSLQQMSKRISDKLTGKRYLLVLDDVWTKDKNLWGQFMVHLKSDTHGSAILLTMRSNDVAETVRSTHQFSLPFLSLDDSWQLFQQSFGMPVKHLDSEFVEVGQQIINKCGGVPLAIKAIAGVLHGKELIEEWQAIRDSNLLDVESEEASVSVSQCLRLSYFHLPSHMKQCFTICSVFPKGYMIYKEQLIDQWIAHDMITREDGVEYLEYIGDKYFNSLVQMSFLQDVSRDRYGRVKCRMHDLVHDLALSILEDNISLVMPKLATGSTKSCRYFSLIERPENLAPKNIFRKARAVYMHRPGYYTNVMALKHAKHLRSVTVEYANAEEVNIISQVKYLKYLSMSLDGCETLPDGFSDVWSLQALHVTNSYSLLRIPESIGKLSKLRTLNLSYCGQLKHLPDSIGNCEMISSIDLRKCIRLIMLPNSMGKLQKLRTLNLSWCQELKCLPDTIGYCQMISSIDLYFCTKLTELTNSIGMLKKIRTLNISCCRELKWLPDTIGDCQMNSSIDLSSCENLTTLPDSIGKLQKLRTLNLSWCTELKCLPDTIGDCQMISSIDSSYMNLTRLPNSIGKLQNLRTLNLLGCRELKCLPDTIGDCQMISSIDLSSCENLTTLPDSIGDCEMISIIDLCSCTKLTGLPKSIGKLQKLRTLNLSRCTELKCLPDTIGDCQMISEIDLSSCKELTTLPDSIGDCEMISSINLCRCAKLIGLPNSIVKLQKLRTLNLSCCRELKCLPDTIGDCQMISRIDLSSCESLTTLPSSIGRNQMLRILRLSCTKIERLPSSITKLRNLECLNLQDCLELVELPEGIGNLENLQVLNLDDHNKLAGMPVGIGQLSRLQKLGLFVVGMGEKFAGTAELANISRIGEELEIRGISHIMDPNDARMACLEQRTNLQRLELYCRENDTELVNTELAQVVLDNMEPPPGIKEQGIYHCSGRQYARWMTNQVSGGIQRPSPFPFLRVLNLFNFLNLKHLHWLVELPCLEDLKLQDMLSLESISGGPFPSLVKLKMHGLPCLEEVWMVIERTMADGLQGRGCCNLTTQLGQIQVGNFLTKLDVSYCPKLEMKPHLPLSVKQLKLCDCEQLLQSLCQCQELQHMRAHVSLDICDFFRVTELPESLCSLLSLRSLRLTSCSNIRVLPESLGELRSLQELTIQHCNSLSSLPQSMGQLTSLQELVIKSCDALHQLPDCLGELCSLCKLEIKNLPELTCLPQSICRLTTSLRELEIHDCPSLTSLLQGMEGLISLKKLSICDCTGLTSLPQGMKGLVSLEELIVWKCPGIQSLPEGIKGLTLWRN